ncbi:MAG: hypothetical protein Q9209_003925 [Squamulea sp. 1 TL-2023]
MGKKRKHLSHEEIWDDSALVNSWDAALQEYQLYHSIHARGEKVDDVLKEAEDSDQVPTDGTADISNTTSEQINVMTHMEAEDGEVEDGEIEDDPLSDVGIMAETMKTKDKILPDQEHYAPPPTVESSSQNVPEPSTVPGVLINGG